MDKQASIISDLEEAYRAIRRALTTATAHGELNSHQIQALTEADTRIASVVIDMKDEAATDRLFDGMVDSYLEDPR